jgi:hypothetical protein
MAIFNIWEVLVDGTPNFENIHELLWLSFLLLHNCSSVCYAVYGLGNGVANICVKLLKPPKN